MSIPEKSHALKHLEETRAAHTAQMMKINDIAAAIAPSKKERDAAIDTIKKRKPTGAPAFVACVGRLRRRCAPSTASASPAVSWPASSPA